MKKIWTEFCSIAAVEYTDKKMGIWRPKINQVMMCGIIVYIENIYVLYLNAFLSVDYLKACSVGPSNSN